MKLIDKKKKKKENEKKLTNLSQLCNLIALLIYVTGNIKCYFFLFLFSNLLYEVYYNDDYMYIDMDIYISVYLFVYSPK